MRGARALLLVRGRRSGLWSCALICADALCATPAPPQHINRPAEVVECVKVCALRARLVIVRAVHA